MESLIYISLLFIIFIQAVIIDMQAHKLKGLQKRDPKTGRFTRKK